MSLRARHIEGGHLFSHKTILNSLMLLKRLYINIIETTPAECAIMFSTTYWYSNELSVYGGYLNELVVLNTHSMC